jgi:hypothetical protein
MEKGPQRKHPAVAPFPYSLFSTPYSLPFVYSTTFRLVSAVARELPPTQIL